MTFVEIAFPVLRPWLYLNTHAEYTIKNLTKHVYYCVVMVVLIIRTWP